MLYASLKGIQSHQEVIETMAIAKANGSKLTLSDIKAHTLYPLVSATSEAMGNLTKSLGRVMEGMLLTAVLYLVFCHSAEAAVSSAPQVSFEEAMNSVLLTAKQVQSVMQDVSQKVLASLVTIGLICFGAKIFTKSTEIFTHFNIGFIYLILLYGFFNFFIINGDKIALDVINSFIILGSTGSVVSIGFTNVYNDFFNLVDAFSNLFINQESLIFVFGLILIYGILTFFLLNFAMTYITSIFVCTFGVIVFAFAFFKSMRFLAINYVKMVLSYGIKMFCLYILFFSGLEVFKLLFNSMAMKITAGQLITVQELGLTIFILCFFLVVSIQIPKVMMGFFWSATSRY